MSTDSLVTDENRAAYLAQNRIAVGPPGDPAEFEREHARFAHLLPARTPLRVLDVGCGTGAWSVHWTARGAHVTGADFDREFLSRARQRPGLTAVSFRGVVADATRLPLASAQFDVVTLNSLLEHVPDWRSVVDEAVRVLAPGGVLVLHTTNARHPFQGEVNGFPFYPWLPAPVRDRVLAWIMAHRRDMVNYTDFPAVHWFSTPQLARVLRAHGLHVFDRFDLMRPEQMTGPRALGRWMLGGAGRALGAKLLFYALTPTVSLYARRPA